MLADLGEEDFAVRVPCTIESDQPINRFASKAVLAGKLAGPQPKSLAQVHERVVEVEQGKPLRHGMAPYLTPLGPWVSSVSVAGPASARTPSRPRI
ncbi:hypothetical protein [Nonomuraea sp. bgisy101]|uniref:hypothetical protein n=1 Tax=Nonomuraea sp. bgisy101 TaxID=3413784 RepID=UPI003D7266A3